MTTSEERIGNWLAACIASEGLPADEPVMISLVHAAVDQAQRLLRTWRIPPDPEVVATLMGEIESAASDDAAELGGMQRYVVKAAIKGRDLGSLSVRYNIDGNTLMPAVDSEPASARGLVAQSQRFAEAVMRLFVQGHGSMVESQQKIINSQQAMIELFQSQQFENVRLQQELAGYQQESQMALEKQRHEQEIELTKTEHREARRDRGMARMIQFAPHVLAWLSKGKIPILPTPEEAAEGQFKRMLAGMDRQAFDKWLAKNAPEEKHGEITFVYDQVQQEKGHAATPGTQGRAEAALSQADPSATRRREEILVKLAQAIYAGFPTIEVVSLAPKVLGGSTWNGLTAAERSSLTSLATTALIACPEIPQVLADDAGRSLWEAVLANAASLPAVVPAVMEGTTWDGLDKDQQLTVLKIANRILGALADAATPTSTSRQAS